MTYFLAACQQSSTPPEPPVVNIVTIERDLVVMRNMEGGIEEMNWETSPDDIKWMKAINDIAAVLKRQNPS